jgi:hypothetical protein
MMEQHFFEEAKRIVEEAEKNGVRLRLIGGTAIKMRSPVYSRALLDKMDRPLTDLDFIALKRDSDKLIRALRNLGYNMDRGKEYLMTVSGRCILEHPATRLHLDIFFDKLAFCHTIDLTKRIDVNNFTIPLADLLLEKMQIVKINEKDIKDTMTLLREHPVTDNDSDSVNGSYVAKLLSKDWGFYYTVTENLKKTKTWLERYDALQPTDKTDIAGKIDRLLKTIETEPKSMKWNMRAKIGTRQKWYDDVEEVPGDMSMHTKAAS